MSSATHIAVNLDQHVSVSHRAIIIDEILKPLSLNVAFAQAFGLARQPAIVECYQTIADRCMDVKFVNGGRHAPDVESGAWQIEPHRSLNGFADQNCPIAQLS